MSERPRPPARLQDDAYLAPFMEVLDRRAAHADALAKRISADCKSLADFASGHTYYGLHRDDEGWVLREWAPNATGITVIGTFTDWDARDGYQMERVNAKGDWELKLAPDAMDHEDLFRLRVYWDGGEGERIPAYARRAVQDPHTHLFNAQVWEPVHAHVWRHAAPDHPTPVPLIYEAHVGMAQEHGGVGTYDEFREWTLPRIADAGYNTVQLMAVMEHPYYGSFGYHVSNFFAASSRCGTPDELKALIDTAHGMGLTVIMDLVHSHAVKNDLEGLGRFDGTRYQYFHEGPRGEHHVWDSLCFDYGKEEVLHFLLSNCRFWMDEYRVDGFRFDGVTSMLYRHHGLGTAFTSYDQYFDDSVDDDAYAYLRLANTLIHTINPNALTVAEDVSGMPGLASPIEDGGCGFGYSLAMGVPDRVFNIVRKYRDEDWDLGALWHELTNRRNDDCTISYVESHDQAIVGSKTLIFELIDADMYHAMDRRTDNMRVDRGLALHKMLRLATLACSGHGYLNFMGNEFGHPEWVDFPREGNGWSYHFARRQWSLRDDPELRYGALADFDRDMLSVVTEADCLTHPYGDLCHIHEDEKLLAFRRGELLFVFNFHPVNSYADHLISVGAGEYRLLLSSDDAAYCGHDRVAPNQRVLSCDRAGGDGTAIRLYLPHRTALVFEAVNPGDPSKHDEPVSQNYFG